MPFSLPPATYKIITYYKKRLFLNLLLVTLVIYWLSFHNPDLDWIVMNKYLIKMRWNFMMVFLLFGILYLGCVCLSSHDLTENWLTSRLSLSKMNWGASTLLILAAFFKIASACATFPWVSNHRGDSGITLGIIQEKNVTQQPFPNPQQNYTDDNMQMILYRKWFPHIWRCQTR